MENNKQHIITYITDCRDDNTKGRLKVRVATCFEGAPVIFVGVKQDTLEAAINLVDVIDAYDDHPGVVLANVAPRHGEGKKWPNGTPFGHVKIGNIDVFSTVDGYTLSLIQKLVGEKLTIQVYDIPKVVPHMNLDEERQERIIHTQFRSFDYLPRLAAAVMNGEKLPYEEYSEVPEMPLATCWIDTFGNIKTNILPEEIGFKVGERVVIRVSQFKQLRLPCYNRMKDVPDDEIGMIIGSSGLGEKRLVEIIQQGKSAAYTLGVGSGAKIEYVPS